MKLSTGDEKFYIAPPRKNVSNVIFVGESMT